MNRFLILLLPALTTCALCIVGPASAMQDDPFGGGTTEPDVTPLVDQPDTLDGRPNVELLDPSVAIIITTIRDSNPQTPKRLADAVRTMMNLAQYEEAKFYLNELASLPLDDKALFELNESIGSDFFFRLSRSVEMAPEGVDFANRLMVAARKTAYDPSRINELINKLEHDNLAIRSDASRELGRLGEIAIAQMLNVFADSSRSGQFASIRASLQNNGASGMRPLVAGSKAENEQVQFESVLALSQVKDPEAFDAIVAAFYSPGTPEHVKEIASKAFIGQYGYFPDRDRVSKAWYRRSKDLLDDEVEIRTRRLGFGDTPALVWRWDPQRNQMVSFQLSRTAERRIRAADKAQVLAEVNPTNGEFQQYYLLTQLEAQKQLAGPTRRINVEAFRQGIDVDAQNISRVLETAISENMVAAAIGACEVLEEMADSSVLSSGTHQPCALVQAILYGDRHLQYAAAKAIAAMDPRNNFAGSSYFTQCVVYMANFAERPGALVGNAREDLATTLAARMIPSGLNGRSAQNGREFYRMATQDANLQYLLVCDTFHRPDYAELVQQLRQDWRTRRLPIAILYRHENESRANRVADNDELTIAMPFTLDPELVRLQVQRLARFSSVWPVTIDERRDHSEFALNWLAKAAKGGEDYAYLDLASHEQQIGKLIFNNGLEQMAAEIMSALGTADSQRTLANYASELGLPIENRQAAAAAFIKSVEQNGVLLTSSEVLQQYDRYNASELDTPESQKVFGSILDAIESKKKSR